MGIEPMTFSLQDWRSTTKLRCLIFSNEACNKFKHLNATSLFFFLISFHSLSLCKLGYKSSITHNICFLFFANMQI